MFRTGFVARPPNGVVRSVQRNSTLHPAVCEALESRTLLSAGDLDTSFGVGGKTSLSIPGLTVKTNDVAVEPDTGNVIVYGTTSDGRMVLASFKGADGTLDTTFGGLNTGYVIFTWGGEGIGQTDAATALAISPDNSIYVLGTLNGTNDSYVSHFSSNGLRDLQFGFGPQFPFIRPDWEFGLDGGGSYPDAPADIVVQNDGKVVVAASVFQGIFDTHDDFGIARLLSNGAQDGSFAGDGTMLVGFDKPAEPTAIAIDYAGGSLANNPYYGSIVAVGTYEPNSTLTMIAAAEVQPGGDTENDFSEDGRTTVTFSPQYSFSQANGVAIQPNGEAVVAAKVGPKASGSHNFGVTWFGLNGQVDTSVGVSGHTEVDFGGDDGANDVIVGQTGDLFVGGNSGTNKSAIVALAKNGLPDGVVGSGGSGGKETIANSTIVAMARTPLGRTFVTTGRSGVNAARFFDRGASVHVSAQATVTSEASLTALAVTFSRDEALNFATRVYYTVGGTASRPGTIPSSQIDYGGVPAPTGLNPIPFVDIPAGQTSATVTITPRSDTRAEFDETVILTISPKPGSYDIVGNSSVTLRILDNDRELSGTVYNDLNANSAHDAGDTPLAGWTVYLDSNNNKKFDAGEPSAVTNSSGQYLFGGLATGGVIIREVLQSGYKRTQPLPPADAYTVIATPGKSADSENFGNIAVSSGTKLSGAVIGTSGSYNNNGNTRDKALDGSLSTWFDAPIANKDNAWVGLDLGSAKVVNEVRYAPRSDFEGRVVGGKIQASNTADFSSGVVTLFTITTAPGSGTLTTQFLSNTTAYRYVHYLAPADSYGNIAEVQFWNAPKLSGTVIGTSGSYSNNGNTRDKVFDGNTATWFDAPAANKDNAWAGLDLGSAKKITRIRFTPRANYASRMVGGIFQGSNTADFSSGVVNLLTVISTPSSGWNDFTISNPGTFRYVRYLAPVDSYGNVAEIEFYGT